MTIFISISTPSSFHNNAKKSLKKKPASVLLEPSLSLDKIKRKRNTATNNRSQSNDSKFIRYQHTNIKSSMNGDIKQQKTLKEKKGCRKSSAATILNAVYLINCINSLSHCK